MTAIIIFIMLALCVTAASAATLNSNLVINKATLQIATTTTAPPGTCPAGCSCMMESDAKEKFGTYSRCSETPCYTVMTGSTALKAYCFRQGTPPTTTTPAPICPEGCNCLSDAQAKERYGDYTRCSSDICGYVQSAATNALSSNQVPKYCVKQGSTTPTCPEGCYCVSEATAKDRYGTYTRCSADVCGYEQDQTAKYCIKPGSTTPTCPEGCSCISEATAKAKGGSWARCSADICGYEQSTATLAAVVQVPKYCMKQQETTPTCPEGCTCLTDATAKEKFGTYTRCSADVCGFETSALTTAAYQIPKYCVKQGSTPVCPDGCACISDEDAKLKGLTERCDNSQTPCGYKAADATTSSAARRIPLYCYKIPTTTSTCPEGCNCLSEAKAKERYGTYTQCTAEICGKEVVPAANGVTAYSVPQYCVKQGSTPVCPDGCACISDEDAKLKGLTDRCDNSQTPCGFRLVAGTANTAATRVPLYCYKIPTTTPVCPQGCACATNATGVEKGLTYCGGKLISCGYNENKQPLYCWQGTSTACPAGCVCATNATGVEKGLTYCSGKLNICGYNENKQPLYCWQGTSTACPQGCACTTDAIAKEKGLTPCRGVRTSCGYDEKQQPVYCFEQVPSPTCVYDYQKNVCAGTCQQGYTCGLLASKKDATGKVEYAVCGCTGQPTGQCTFDKEKNACTGACQNGGTCAIVGKKVDDKTGEVFVVCGCPQPTSEQCTFDKEKQTCIGTCQSGAACAIIGKKTDDKTGEVYTFCGCPPQPSSCSYDYGKDACVGTCTITGDNCQLNTIYRDPTTGKVTYAECHCKGSGGTPTCALDANNRCSGSCPQGGQCTSITTKDDSGAEKVSCGCGSAQPGTPAGVATRQPGILDAIGSFFNRLFGGK